MRQSYKPNNLFYGNISVRTSGKYRKTRTRQGAEFRVEQIRRVTNHDLGFRQAADTCKCYKCYFSYHNTLEYGKASIVVMQTHSVSGLMWSWLPIDLPAMDDGPATHPATNYKFVCYLREAALLIGNYRSGLLENYYEATKKQRLQA